MQQSKAHGPKDGAKRQADWKARQRKMGRRRAEYWVTDPERRELDETLSRIRHERI